MTYSSSHEHFGVSMHPLSVNPGLHDLMLHVIWSPWFSYFSPPDFPKSSGDDVRKLDDEIWELISNFSQGPPASFFSSSSSSSSSSTSSIPVRTPDSAGRSRGRAPVPPLPPLPLQASVLASGPYPGAPGSFPHRTTVKVFYMVFQKWFTFGVIGCSIGLTLV